MSDERRKSFRIDNPVALLYKVVSEAEMQRSAAEIKEGGFLPGGMSATLFGMEAELKGRINRDFIEKNRGAVIQILDYIRI